MRTSGLMGGTDLKTTFAMVITLGFWLLRLVKARPTVSPMLNWNWMRPIGNTKTSPLFITLVKSLFGLDMKNPTKKVPLMTTKSSMPQGWVWGGFRPYGAKSRRAKDMPRVLRPANLLTLTRVTFDPTLFPVFQGILSSEKKKSFAETIAGTLQNLHSQTVHIERKVSYCCKKGERFLLEIVEEWGNRLQSHKSNIERFDVCPKVAKLVGWTTRFFSLLLPVKP